MNFISLQVYAAYSLYIAIRTCHLFIKSIIFEKMSVVLFLREGGRGGGVNISLERYCTQQMILL